MGIPRDRAFWCYSLESAPPVVVSLLLSHPLALVLDLLAALVFVLIGPAVVVGLLAVDPRVMHEHASTVPWRLAHRTGLASVIAYGVVALA